MTNSTTATTTPTTTSSGSSPEPDKAAAAAAITTSAPTSPSTITTSDVSAAGGGKPAPWTAKQRTQLLEYYFEKHTLSGAEWAEIADKLGKNKVHCSLQFKRIIKPRALKAQE